MKKTIDKTIYKIAEEVLEKLAFILSLPSDEEDEPENLVAACVSFSGPFSGALVLGISQEVLPELAGNMLGTDDETSQSDQYDALCELINVICGNLLPEIAGKDAVFNVDSPKIVDETFTPDSIRNIREDGLKADVRLPLDEGSCRLYLFVDGDVSFDDFESA